MYCQVLFSQFFTFSHVFSPYYLPDFISLFVIDSFPLDAWVDCVLANCNHVDEGGWRRRRRRRREKTNIKSNNPRLTGGERHMFFSYVLLFFLWINYAYLYMCKIPYWSNPIESESGYQQYFLELALVRPSALPVLRVRFKLPWRKALMTWTTLDSVAWTIGPSGAAMPRWQAQRCLHLAIHWIRSTASLCFILFLELALIKGEKDRLYLQETL